MYEGRQLHLEDGRLGEEVVVNPVEVDDVHEVDVGEVGKVESSARPCTKQVRLPTVTK